MANISFRLRKNSLMEPGITLFFEKNKAILGTWQSTLMSVFYLPPAPAYFICKTLLLSCQNLRVLCPPLTSQFSFAKLSRLSGIFTVFTLSSPHSTSRDWPLAIKPAEHLLLFARQFICPS